MDELDIKLLNEIAKGIPIVSEPFSEIADKLKISPKEVVARIAKLQEMGIIRRFGASIKPNNLGLSANALVAWNIPEKRVQEVGTYLSKFKEITHCYQRKPVDGKWDYNLYTVLHGQERKVIEQFVGNLSKIVEISDYIILYSTKDLKKSSAFIVPAESSTQPYSLSGKSFGGKAT